MVEKVLLASPRGYCAGVERAVETVERALDLYGTKDEVLKPEVVQSVLTNVGPHCAKYRMAYLDGYHHSIIADHVHAYASLWLDAIKSGFCRPR